VAANCLELFQKTLVLAKENLTKVEVRKLLLGTDNKGRTIFHVAAPFSELFQGY
jgi:aminoglycoside N3'-acetyltransferase